MIFRKRESRKRRFEEKFSINKLKDHVEGHLAVEALHARVNFASSNLFFFVFDNTFEARAARVRKVDAITTVPIFRKAVSDGGVEVKLGLTFFVAGTEDTKAPSVTGSHGGAFIRVLEEQNGTSIDGSFTPESDHIEVKFSNHHAIFIRNKVAKVTNVAVCAIFVGATMVFEPRVKVTTEGKAITTSSIRRFMDVPGVNCVGRKAGNVKSDSSAFFDTILTVLTVQPPAVNLDPTFDASSSTTDVEGIAQFIDVTSVAFIQDGGEDGGNEVFVINAVILFNETHGLPKTIVGIKGGSRSHSDKGNDECDNESDKEKSNSFADTLHLSDLLSVQESSLGFFLSGFVVR